MVSHVWRKGITATALNSSIAIAIAIAARSPSGRRLIVFD